MKCITAELSDLEIIFEFLPELSKSWNTLHMQFLNTVLKLYTDK